MSKSNDGIKIKKEVEGKMSKENESKARKESSLENKENLLVGEKLAEFVLNTKYGNIPKHLVSFIKVLTLKNIANMVAGASLLHSRKLANIVRERRLPEAM